MFLRLLGGCAFVAVLAACSVRDPLYCDQNQPCTDPDRPFCDLEGAYPDSEGVKRTCIPDPGLDPGADAGPGADSDVAPSGPDAATPICTPSAFVQCTDDDTALHCSEDGFEYLTVDCGSECSTEQGGCYCEPNTSSCADNQAVRCNADGQVEEIDTCALGCNESGLRCVDVAPSNDLGAYLDMSSDGPVVALSNGATIDTDAGAVVDGDGTVIEVPEFQLPAPPGGVAVRVFAVKSLSLRDTFITGIRALAVVSDGDISVGGHVRILAGAMLTSDCIGGRGELGRCGVNCEAHGGGGGGSFGGAGRNGGTAVTAGEVGEGGEAGQTRGNQTLTPLRGGCAGGGSPQQPVGGDGGGAIQLVSRTLIRIEDRTAEAHLDAGGRGGLPIRGGGSGGGILLEAPRVIVSSGTSIVANGGAGGSGGCGSAAEDGTLDNTSSRGGGVGCEESPDLGQGGNGAGRLNSATDGESVVSGLGSFTKAGGGGGGLGRIRVNVPVTTDFVEGGVVSPAPRIGSLATR